MDVRQLRYLVQIIELGSFGKASSALRIAQPALSSQVRNLEEELGVQLLIRHSSGVAATAAGKTLHDHARGILAAIETAKQATIDHAEDVTGTVKLGVPPSLCEAAGIEIVRTMQARHPEVSVVLVEGLSAHLQNWLVDGSLDLAVMDAPQAGKLIQTRPLYEEDLLVVASTEGPGLPDPIGSLSALAGRPLIMPPFPNNLTRMLSKRFAEADLDFEVAYTVNTTSAILRLVVAGLGYTVLPYLAVRSGLSAGTLRAWWLPGPPLYRVMAAAWMNERPLTRALQETRQVVEDVVAALEPGELNAIRLLVPTAEPDDSVPAATG